MPGAILRKSSVVQKTSCRIRSQIGFSICHHSTFVFLIIGSCFDTCKKEMTYFLQWCFNNFISPFISSQESQSDVPIYNTI